MHRAKKKLEEIETEFQESFGRSYGGQIEEYRCEDAEIVLVSMGSCVGMAKVMVDQKREQGMKVGLVKIRLFRPFPKERVGHVLKDKKAICVVERSVSFGWNSGHLLQEIKAALYDGDKNPPILDFIDGLNGGDITLEHMEKVIEATHQAAQGKPYQEVTLLEL